MVRQNWSQRRCSRVNPAALKNAVWKRRSALVDARTSDLRRLIDLTDSILERLYQRPTVVTHCPFNGQHREGLTQGHELVEVSATERPRHMGCGSRRLRRVTRRPPVPMLVPAAVVTPPVPTCPATMRSAWARRLSSITVAASAKDHE